jgi:FKBP-type peptidyl-prolyl cis-trans isomerase FkpA
MKRKTSFFLMFATMAIVLSSCSKYKGYDKTENGLYYKIHTTSADAVKPQIGDVLTLTMVYKTENDSVIEDSRTKPYPFMIVLSEPQYKADIYEGLALLAKGDSATFILRADSFYLKTAGFPEVPAYVTKDMMLYFDLKVEDIKPRAQFEQEMAEMQRQYDEEMAKNKETEPEQIANYIKENNIKAKPNASGLYYIELQKGTGAAAEKGKKCLVHYKGTLLDGRVFDSSEGREPFEFVLGQDAVIEGWHQGIAMMKVGGKARLLIPSSLAYGERGAGNSIPPYAPLMFDVELVAVK